MEAKEASIKSKKLSILFAASEVAPIAKVGGLADVVGSLPKALSGLGHDVRLVMPGYGIIDQARFGVEPLSTGHWVMSMKKREPFSLMVGSLREGIPVYMVENERYFGCQTIYEGATDLERFYFFSRAVADVVTKLDWQPDIIHCHDWHVALVPLWLRSRHMPLATVFTIHNLAYQGAFDQLFMQASELGQEWARWLGDAPQPPFTLMSQGVLQADMVTTVSETYAKEILTPEYGGGLEKLLQFRTDRLIGILNGIDYQEFNPATDPHLVANYDAATLDKKAANKAALQQRAKLPVKADIPVIGMVSRLDDQKGFDLLEKAVESILGQMKVQLVILGTGREHYHQMLSQMAQQYPSKMAVFLAFDNPLAHLIYGGCDLFLMPSRFEPCGLGQLISMRYGTIPIVRHTGGLVDTVKECSSDLEQGQGFTFIPYEPEALVAAVSKAVASFSRKDAWRRLMARVMGLDFSWGASAKKYETVYNSVLKDKWGEVAKNSRR